MHSNPVLLETDWQSWTPHSSVASILFPLLQVFFLHLPLRHGFKVFNFTEMAAREHRKTHDVEQTVKMIHRHATTHATAKNKVEETLHLCARRVGGALCMRAVEHAARSTFHRLCIRMRMIWITFITVLVNSTPHSSHFLVNSHPMTRTCVAQGSSSCLACVAHISHHLMRHLHSLMLCV